jgi:signal peptidase I
MKSAAVETPNVREISVFDLRKQARRWAWFCPGGGFACFRQPIAAAVTYYSAMATLIAALVLAWSPSGAWLAATLVLLAFGTIAWIAEIITTYLAWTTPEAVTSARSYRLKGVILWLLVAAFGGSVAMNYRVVEIASDGMSPTVQLGNRVLYRRGVRSADLTPGTLILFKLHADNKAKEAGSLEMARILAVPDDVMQSRGGMFYVNERAEKAIGPAGDYPRVLVIAGPPGTAKIPKGCYFVVQDSRENGLDSRVLALAHREDIVSAQFFSLSSFPPFKPIK